MTERIEYRPTSESGHGIVEVERDTLFLILVGRVQEMDVVAQVGRRCSRRGGGSELKVPRDVDETAGDHELEQVREVESRAVGHSVGAGNIEGQVGSAWAVDELKSRIGHVQNGREGFLDPVEFI